MLLPYLRKFKFVTLQYVTEREITILDKAFDNTFRVWNQAGFNIQIINVDPGFEKMGDTFKDIGITMNYATAHKHVTEIERSIRTIKEYAEPYIIYFHITLYQKWWYYTE